MKQWLNKKVLIAVTVAAVLTSVGAVAYAGSTVKKIQAYQNAGISIKVDGSKVNLTEGGEQLYPIVYKGRTYIPAAPVMEALGGSVAWNAATSSVDITSAEDDANAGIPIKDAGPSTPPTSNDGAAADTGSTSIPLFSSDTTAKEMFEAVKPAASYLIQVYADALKSGKDDKMDAWLRGNIGKSEYGNYFYEDSLDRFNDSIESYRESYDSSVITPIANSAYNRAKALTFNEDSEYSDGIYSRTLEYLVDVESDDYEGMIGIYFNIDLNEETDQYYLSSLSFY